MSATEAPTLTPAPVRAMLVADAAAYLGIQPETVRRRIRAGTLQAHRAALHGRSVLVVDVPTRSTDATAPAPGVGASMEPEGHRAAPEGHHAPAVAAGSVDVVTRAYDAHLADLRDALARLEASHRDEIARLTEAHRAALEAHRATLDALTQAHEHASRRIDDLVAANRRRWWHLW